MVKIELWSGLCHQLAFCHLQCCVIGCTFHASRLTITTTTPFDFYCRGDKEEERRADVADEDAERSKHFDEEVGSGSHNRGTTTERSLKTGDASTSTPGIVDNKNIGKDTDRKV